NIRILFANIQTEDAQAERQIECGGGFEDATLAGGDRDHRVDTPYFGPHLVAVKPTSANRTLGTVRTPSSTTLRTGSQAFTAAASTVREKNTLPSLTTTSDSTRASVSAAPPGDGTFAKAAKICPLLTAIIALPFQPPARLRRHHKLRGRAVNVACYQEWLTRPHPQ